MPYDRSVRRGNGRTRSESTSSIPTPGKSTRVQTFGVPRAMVTPKQQPIEPIEEQPLAPVEPTETEAETEAETDAEPTEAEIEAAVDDLPTLSDDELAAKQAATQRSKQAIEAALAPLRKRYAKAKGPERQRLAWQLFVAMNPTLSSLAADELARVRERFDAEYVAKQKRRAERVALVKAIVRTNNAGSDRRGSTKKRDARHDAQWALFRFDNPGFDTLDADAKEQATAGFEAAFAKFEARRARMEQLRSGVDAATKPVKKTDRLGFPYAETPAPTAALEASYRELVALGLGVDAQAKAVTAKWLELRGKITARIAKERAALEKARAAARDGNYREQAAAIFQSKYGNDPEAARGVCEWAYGGAVWQDTKIAGLAGHRVIDLLYNTSGPRLVGATRVEYILRAIAWKHLETDETRARSKSGSPLYLDLQKWGRGVTDEAMASYTDKTITQEIRRTMKPDARIKLEEAVADAELRRALGRGNKVPTTEAEQDRFVAPIVGTTPTLVDGTPYKLGDFDNQMYAVAAYQKGVHDKLEQELPPEIAKLDGEVTTLATKIDEIKATESTLGRATGQWWARDADQQLKLQGERRAELEKRYQEKAALLQKKRAELAYVRTVRPQLQRYLDEVKTGRPTTDAALKAAFPQLYEMKILRPMSMSEVLFPGQPVPDRIPVTAQQLSTENLDRVEAVLKQRLAQREQQTADGAGKLAGSMIGPAGPGNELYVLYQLINAYDAKREINLSVMDRDDIARALELVAKARTDIQKGVPFVPGMLSTGGVGQRMEQYRTSWSRGGNALLAGAEDASAFALRVVGGALDYSLPGLAEWGTDKLTRQLVGEPPMQFGLMWMADRLCDGAAWLEKDAEANFAKTGGGFDVELLRFGANMVLTALPTLGFGAVGSAVGAALKAGRWGKLLLTSASLGSMGVLATADQDWSVKLRTIIPMAALPVGGGALAKSGVTTRLVGSFLSNALSDVLVSADYAAAWQELQKGNITGAVQAAGRTINPARAIINGLAGVAFEGAQVKGERSLAAQADTMPIVISETVDANGTKTVQAARIVADGGETRMEPIKDATQIEKLREQRGALQVRPDEFAIVVDPKAPASEVGAILGRAEMAKAARAETEAGIKSVEKTLPLLAGDERAVAQKQLEQLGSVKDALDRKPLGDAEVDGIGVPPGYYKPAGGSEWVFDPRVERFQLELARQEAAALAAPEQAYWASREALTKNVIALDEARQSKAKNAARITELEAENKRLMQQLVAHEIELNRVRGEHLTGLRDRMIADFERQIGGTVRAPRETTTTTQPQSIVIPAGTEPVPGGHGIIYKVNAGGADGALKVMPEGGNIDIALAGAQLPAKYGGLESGAIVPVNLGGKATQGVLMPWVEGETLASASRTTPKQLAEFDRYTQAAIDDGVVIADLNASNVMLRDSGVTIVDAPLVTKDTFTQALKKVQGDGVTSEVIEQQWKIAQDTFKANVKALRDQLRMKKPWWEYRDGDQTLDPTNLREAPQYLGSGSQSDAWTHKGNYVVKTLSPGEMYGGLSPDAGARMFAAVEKLNAKANEILGNEAVPKSKAMTSRPVLVQKKVVDGKRLVELPEPQRSQLIGQARQMIQKLVTELKLPLTEQAWRPGNMLTVTTWSVDGNLSNFLVTPDGQMHWIDPFFPPSPEMIQANPEILDVP